MTEAVGAAPLAVIVFPSAKANTDNASSQSFFRPSMPSSLSLCIHFLFLLGSDRQVGYGVMLWSVEPSVFPEAHFGPAVNGWLHTPNVISAWLNSTGVICTLKISPFLHMSLFLERTSLETHYRILYFVCWCSGGGGFAQWFTIGFYVTLWQRSAFQCDNDNSAIIHSSGESFKFTSTVFFFLSETSAVRNCFYFLFLKIYIISSVLLSFQALYEMYCKLLKAFKFIFWT